MVELFIVVDFVFPYLKDHAVFVSNLPPSLSQRQYERILLKLLSIKEKPFCAIGPIYFEYGSLVITFNTPKAATAAVVKLQNAVYEDKKLVVLCLPNVQSHMVGINHLHWLQRILEDSTRC